MCPFELFLWIPPETVIKESIRILDCHASPSRVSVSSFSHWSFNVNLIFGVVRDPWFTINCWDGHVETSEIIFSNSKFFSIPIVEFTKNGNGFSTWCPLFVNDITIWLQIETVFHVGATNVKEATFGFFEYVKPSKK